MTRETVGPAALDFEFSKSAGTPRRNSAMWQKSQSGPGAQVCLQVFKQERAISSVSGGFEVVPCGDQHRFETESNAVFDQLQTLSRRVVL